ncbi:MAG: 30S ribosomal protein S16 [Calditrichaeota bacterium]|nr:MAG: 30S ribosomal protein S16 [Calditrichota bacterium]
MAVRLRLRRMGRKKRPFYRIVAIDSRAKRDGKYLESIGYYNPITDPFELKIDSDRALFWLQRGAQPSDTVRSLFRKQGIMLRWHLQRHGKSEAEIETELKKWEELQREKLKKLEAARIQEMRSKKKEMPVSEEAPETVEAVTETAEPEAAAAAEPAEEAPAPEDKAPAEEPEPQAAAEAADSAAEPDKQEVKEEAASAEKEPAQAQAAENVTQEATEEPEKSGGKSGKDGPDASQPS